MRAFTYDAESTELTAAECEAFALTVARECRVRQQHGISVFLSCVRVRQGEDVCRVVEAAVTAIWLAPRPVNR